MVKVVLIAVSMILGASAFAAGKETRKPSSADITIRTENYPRPPYSGATYFIYEQNGKQICTKLKVCNKFDDCEVTYYKGAFKDSDDVTPFDTTPAEVIAQDNLHKHLCLTKFHIVK